MKILDNTQNHLELENCVVACTAAKPRRAIVFLRVKLIMKRFNSFSMYQKYKRNLFKHLTFNKWKEKCFLYKLTMFSNQYFSLKILPYLTKTLIKNR